MPADGIKQQARPLAIREAATAAFAERGYHATGMKDIAAALGIQAPTLYNHVDSKQTLLRDIMFGTMNALIADHESAISTTRDCVEQLRRSMEAHVRYHLRHQLETRIGNNEIASLEEPARDEIRDMRRRYARSWQRIVERGVEEGRFETISSQLSTYAMLEMGIGVALWYREDGPLSESHVVYAYGDMALRLVLPPS
ncbi:MAG: TetR/AcrR family transcriptional regulator [Solirubrobacteraceae bacterium]